MNTEEIDELMFLTMKRHCKWNLGMINTVFEFAFGKRLVYNAKIGNIIELVYYYGNGDDRFIQIEVENPLLLKALPVKDNDEDWTVSSSEAKAILIELIPLIEDELIMQGKIN